MIEYFYFQGKHGSVERDNISSTKSMTHDVSIEECISSVLSDSKRKSSVSFDSEHNRSSSFTRFTPPPSSNTIGVYTSAAVKSINYRNMINLIVFS